MQLLPRTSFLGLLLLSALAALPLHGQDGQTAGEYAYTPTGTDWDEWDDVNTEAWSSFESFDMERWVGTWDDQSFGLNFSYESQTVIWGSQAAQQSIMPEFVWLGPLFGGEGYTSIKGIIPLDSRFSEQMFIYGGWKYHLTPDVDVDIGGNIVLATKQNYGPGVPTPWGSGWSDRGTVYIGLIANCLLHPSVYMEYDFMLDQKNLIFAIQQDWDLHEEFGLPEGLVLDFEARFGWLSANAWLGNGRTPGGQQWRNGYVYSENQLNLIYNFFEGFSTYVGVRYAWNNDGTGPTGINGIEMGPDSMVWFGAGVGYEF
ncbi:hypothetical protein H5P28_19060 [Ruficoccus amylovorans]|uniref:Uncharacterized protein n=1 Tax=Ruficoccus amylovorans TaxID=1804625 RepID=A0A842HIN1_9BACT|nr:hypothetical protein [Ruficoccus amylovorans]MBC2596373.1 hypothetical protein [Ruficoccus amylovorans]